MYIQIENWNESKFVELGIRQEKIYWFDINKYSINIDEYSNDL